jgi:hypothetical protein
MAPNTPAGTTRTDAQTNPSASRNDDTSTTGDGSTPKSEPITFDQTDSRKSDMHHEIDRWVNELVAATKDARESREFKTWLNAQLAFHDYSYRNTILIRRQCPDATKVAGYNTWHDEFNRYVKEGESAIWIWAPIVTTRCPDCHNSPSYHKNSDCDYDATPPSSWNEGLVGFRPAAVFDISQTEGEPLPELDYAPSGDPDTLVDDTLDLADRLNFDVSLIPADEWAYDSKGRCVQDPIDLEPYIEVKDRDNDASLAHTIVHELAHAELHGVRDDDSIDRPKREVEAEATAYVVCRYAGLDMSGSAFYLAAWAGDDPDVIQNRLKRINRTASRFIELLDEIQATSELS